MLVRGSVGLRGARLDPGRPRGLIHFGGNAEDVDKRRPAFGGAFPVHTICLVAYRGYGASGGRPTEAAVVVDAVALRQRVVDEHGCTDLIGRSLGSAVAMRIGRRAAVRRMVLVTPLDSARAAGADVVPRLASRLLVSPPRRKRSDDPSGPYRRPPGSDAGGRGGRFS
ncbi:MAG: hypothetical protein FWE71_15145 [Nocardioidaceae bacterium]|nr:hypothetical protein [Nocardioidaceae bacterium]